MIICEKTKFLYLEIYKIYSNNNKAVKKLSTGEIKQYFTSVNDDISDYDEADITVDEYLKEQRYNSRIVQLIRLKYSLNDEIAINRQRFSKEEEFEEYDRYVESCKATAKAEIYGG